MASSQWWRATRWSLLQCPDQVESRGQAVDHSDGDPGDALLPDLLPLGLELVDSGVDGARRPEHNYVRAPP
ncbi:hypothetical protein [Streptomyces sp. MJP52]|uniref:hypothetical protein n=1 Tax=Streptomyces sp. MJP52 TaxID=2940555 RepID=UPI002473DBED|nr:hypothetical protein [Streptomyces sp. MJP52]MDH6223599.1 hypothetical protein [Streptomyces sp. MJP52]